MGRLLHMFLAVVLAAGTFVLGGAHARAQSEAALEDPRLQSVRGRIRGAVQAARSEGLPDEWLLDKVAEGLSKRVPPPLIARAVEQLLVRMRTAHELVRPVEGGDRRALLRRGLDALSAGAPRARLEALVRDVGVSDADRVLQALTTVAELAERGFGADAAVQATVDAARRGRGRGMRELLERGRRIGGGAGDRDGALRRAGRSVRTRGRTIDRGGPTRDHGSRGQGRIR